MAQGPHNYERDERWTACDEFAGTHLLPQDPALRDHLRFALDLSAQKGLEKIEVSPLQGQFLALQCRMVRAKHVLEVGTLGGYSDIWLASASPDVKITTIEISSLHKEVAEQVLTHANLQDRVSVVLGSGVEVLPRLRKEVDAGERPKFEFVFIDADKQNNLFYLQEAVPMCHPGACIVVDNVVRRGNLANQELAKSDERVRGSRAVIEAAGADPRLECTMLQTVGAKNYDGFLMCVVK